jgi:hypothetical protein
MINRVCDDALEAAQQLAETIVQQFSRDQLLALKSALAT